MSVKMDCKKSQKVIVEMCQEMDRLKSLKYTLAVKRGMVIRKGMVYRCQKCGDTDIWMDYKYCPNCGRKIKWQITKY